MMTKESKIGVIFRRSKMRMSLALLSSACPMRKWLWFAIPVIAVGIGTAYWYFGSNSTVVPTPIDDGKQTAIKPQAPGDAEESDVIEPLIVDRGKVAHTPAAAPVDS